MRKIVRRIAVIRPTQFSALKTFHHPDEEEESGEDNDRYADDQQVIHGGSLLLPRGASIARRGAWLAAGRTAIIKALIRGVNCCSHGSHAAPAQFLTDPMREPGGRGTGPPGS